MLTSLRSRGIVLVLLVAGCSGAPPMVPVTGLVTLNGKPIENCQVCFFPEDESIDPNKAGYGLAYTDADGKYEIANPQGDKGIFPGRYKVVLNFYTNREGKPLPKTAKPSETPGGFVNQMPKPYHDPKTTPETVEVPRGGCTRDFKIVK